MSKNNSLLLMLIPCTVITFYGIYLTPINYTLVGVGFAGAITIGVTAAAMDD